jgi:hypothetical protein
VKRRDLLVVGGLVSLALATPPLLRWRAANGPFEFTPLSGLAPFRRLRAGSLSGARDIAMVGIGQPNDTTPDIPASDLCSNLFEPAPDGHLPVAVFTDYYCPYCRGLSDRLIERATRQNLHLTWHELPLLGAGSLRSARAAIAAREQGSYLPVHKHLMDTVLRPSLNARRALAEQFGLNVDQFMADHDGPLPDQHFARSKGLARLLGLPGTPSTVVGRTVVIGAIDDRQLDRLIDLERGLSDACA